MPSVKGSSLSLQSNRLQTPGRALLDELRAELASAPLAPLAGRGSVKPPREANNLNRYQHRSRVNKASQDGDKPSISESNQNNVPGELREPVDENSILYNHHKSHPIPSNPSASHLPVVHNDGNTTIVNGVEIPTLVLPPTVDAQTSIAASYLSARDTYRAEQPQEGANQSSGSDGDSARFSGLAHDGSMGPEEASGRFSWEEANGSSRLEERQASATMASSSTSHTAQGAELGDAEALSGPPQGSPRVRNIQSGRMNRMNPRAESQAPRRVMSARGRNEAPQYSQRSASGSDPSRRCYSARPGSKVRGAQGLADMDVEASLLSDLPEPQYDAYWQPWAHWAQPLTDRPSSSRRGNAWFRYFVPSTSARPPSARSGAASRPPSASAPPMPDQGAGGAGGEAVGGDLFSDPTQAADGAPAEGRGGGYQHYDARVQWDPEARELDDTTFSREWDFRRMYYCKVPGHGGSDPAEADAKASGGPEEKRSLEDLWRSYCAVDLREDQDVEELSHWAARLQPRTLKDLKPLLILCQGLLLDYLEGRRRFHLAQLDEVRRQYEEEVARLQAENDRLKAGVVEYKADALRERRARLRNKLTQAVKKVQAGRALMQKKAMETSMKEEQTRTTDRSAEIERLRQHIAALMKDVAHLHSQLDAANYQLLKKEEKEESDTVIIKQLQEDIPQELLDLIRSPSTGAFFRNMRLVKVVSDPQHVPEALHGQLLRLLSDRHFCTVAKDKPSLVHTLTTCKSFVTQLGRKEFASAVGDERFLYPLHEEVDAGFLALLRDRDFLHAVEHGAACRTLAHSHLLAAVAAPQLQALVPHGNFVDAMRHDAAPIFVARPEVWEMLVHPGFLRALEEGTELWELLDQMAQRQEEADAETGADAEVQVDEDAIVADLERAGERLGELQSMQDLRLLEDPRHSLQKLVLLGFRDWRHLFARWCSHMFGDDDLRLRTGANLLGQFSELVHRILVRTTPPLTEDSTKEMQETLSPVPAQTGERVMWLKDRLEKDFDLPPVAMKVAGSHLVHSNEQVLYALAAWVFIANAGLQAPATQHALQELDFLLAGAREGAEEGDWARARAYINMVHSGCDDLYAQLAPANTAAQTIYRPLIAVLLEIFSALGVNLEELTEKEDLLVLEEHLQFAQFREERIKSLPGWSSDEHNLLKLSAEKHVNSLRCLYMDHSPGGLMNMNKLITLVRHCGIMDNKVVTSGKVSLAFTIANTPDEAGTPVTMHLTPVEYSEVLLRLAAMKYEAKRSLSLSAKFGRLMTDHVVPNVQQSEQEQFRRLLQKHEIQEVFRTLEEEISIVFNHYSQQDVGGAFSAQSSTTDVARPKVSTMNPREVETMLNDAHLLGGRLIKSDLQKIMANVQHEAVDIERTDVDRDEFEKMLFLCALFRDPNPFTATHKRFQSFLVRDLFPGLHDRGKIKGLKGPYGGKAALSERRMSRTGKGAWRDGKKKVSAIMAFSPLGRQQRSGSNPAPLTAEVLSVGGAVPPVQDRAAPVGSRRRTIEPNLAAAGQGGEPGATPPPASLRNRRGSVVMRLEDFTPAALAEAP